MPPPPSSVVAEAKKCDNEMLNLRDAFSQKNREHGKLVERGFFKLRSIEEEIKMMRQYAPIRFQMCIVDATSSSEQKWKVRARAAHAEGVSINRTDKKKTFTGMEIIDELDRLDRAKEVALC